MRNFLIENETQLSRNTRVAMPYRSIAVMDRARRAQIEADAVAFFASPEMDPGSRQYNQGQGGCTAGAG